MPFTSWSGRSDPRKLGLGRQGLSPSSLSKHGSRQKANTWGGQGLAPAWLSWQPDLLCPAPLPLLSRCGKVNQPQEIARLSLSRILSHPECNHLSLSSVPTLVQPPSSPHGEHSGLLPGLPLSSPSPQFAPHTQGACEPQDQVRAFGAQSLPRCTSLLVKARAPHYRLSP